MKTKNQNTKNNFGRVMLFGAVALLSTSILVACNEGAVEDKNTDGDPLVENDSVDVINDQIDTFEVAVDTIEMIEDLDENVNEDIVE